MSQEITVLSSTVETLKNNIQSLHQEVSSQTVPPRDSHLLESQSNRHGRNSQSNSPPSRLPSHLHRVPPSPPPQSRRFNIVLSGIDEHPPGTPRSVRLSRDVASIFSVLDKLVDSLSDQSIRDCIHLGKFRTTGSRPILVTLNRVSDVSKILSKKHKLSDCSPGILIRPDLSPCQRKARSLLVRERRKLLQSGPTVRASIRMNSTSLFVDGTKVGSVTAGVYTPFSPVTLPGSPDPAIPSEQSLDEPADESGDHSSAPFQTGSPIQSLNTSVPTLQNQGEDSSSPE
uniref:Uncharacterized protein n=1 Tax=Amphimedon queenslandica TaxID=400682 RepID=A0A1X7V5X7_AMPQE